ncbi:MAG: hypothetical protein MZW92_14520 [Comamonadaceae bacterium]|nr:hypothetical protein [Comamonadaceae bacterium]
MPVLARHAVEPRRHAAADELERVAHAIEAELKRVPGSARGADHRRPRPRGAGDAASPSAAARARRRRAAACSARWPRPTSGMPAGSVIDDAGGADAGGRDRRVPALGRRRRRPRRRRARRAARSTCARWREVDGRRGAAARATSGSRPAPARGRSGSPAAGRRRLPGGDADADEEAGRRTRSTSPRAARAARRRAAQHR